MMSWRLRQSAFVALSVTLMMLLTLAAVPGSRDSRVRVARAGAQRLDSAEAVHDHGVVDVTVEAPTTSLFQAEQGYGRSATPLLAVSVAALHAPALHEADAPFIAAEHHVARSIRPSSGRGPPTL